jgi:hypothetical protein
LTPNPFFGVNVVGRTTFQVTTFHVPSVGWPVLSQAPPKARRGAQVQHLTTLPGAQLGGLVGVSLIPASVTPEPRSLQGRRGEQDGSVGHQYLSYNFS